MQPTLYTLPQRVQPQKRVLWKAGRDELPAVVVCIRDDDAVARGLAYAEGDPIQRFLNRVEKCLSQDRELYRPCSIAYTLKTALFVHRRMCPYVMQSVVKAPHSLTLAPTAASTTVRGTQLFANKVSEICAEGSGVIRRSDRMSASIGGAPCTTQWVGGQGTCPWSEICSMAKYAFAHTPPPVARQKGQVIKSIATRQSFMREKIPSGTYDLLPIVVTRCPKTRWPQTCHRQMMKYTRRNP